MSLKSLFREDFKYNQKIIFGICKLYLNYPLIGAELSSKLEHPITSKIATDFIFLLIFLETDAR